MIQDRSMTINQFIKFTPGGIKIADFEQIQTTLIDKYKEIFGTDIDIANTTADGIFINNLSLIINNILQSFKTLYSNLNVNTASGIYLDNLCKLSNISRKMATYSTAQLLITSLEDTTLKRNEIFIDNNGIEWYYKGENLNIQANSDAKLIIVQCAELGGIIAKANSINKTLEVSPLIISQPNDAIIGRENETDSELRARRNQSNGAQGITVEESLVGALLEVSGILDCKIIVNNTNVNKTALDSKDILAHNVYIIIRKQLNVEIENQIIGQIILDRMTPGISTTQATTNENGIAKEYENHLDDNITWLNQKVYWKEAKFISPEFTVTITKGINYVDNTDDIIAQEIISYMNNLHISQIPSENDIIITATYADVNPRYIVKETNISTQITSNPETYYYYNHYEVQDVENTNDIKFTFSYVEN